LWGLIPYFVLLSGYTVWWGGFCFGPRYWTDAVPLFAVILACGLEWARARAGPVLLVLAVTIVWSVGVQALGAFCYPSSWNLKPTNIDTQHDRLWDWADSEMTRCLQEKVFKK
jgi:hypothetical protein